MKKFLLFTFFLAASNLYGQTFIIDSLKKVIDEYDAPLDSTYINLRLGFVENNIFSGIGDSTVLAYTMETQAIAEELNYKKGIVMAIQRIGILYQYFLNKPLEAVNLYQLALDLIGNDKYLKQHKFVSLNNLATIYTNHKDYTKALEINISLLKMGLPKYGKTLHDIGSIHTNLEQFDSAIYYFNRAIDTLKRSIDVQHYTLEHAELANTYLNLSYVNIQLEKADSAMLHLNKAIELIDLYDINFIKARTYINASEIYLLFDSLNKAEEYAVLAFDLGIEKQTVRQQRDVQYAFYKIYSRQGLYKEALEAYQSAKILEDSISSADRRVEVSRKVMEFEAKQKEALAEQALLKQKFLANTYLISGTSLVLIISLIFIFVYQRRKSIIRTKEVEFKKNLAESKLIALRTQLNPHFIFNALNSIDQYMITHGTEQASDYLVKFSALMRKILENSNENWITLAEELKLMRVYVEIEALRLKEPLKLNVKLEQDIEPDNTIVPSLFIQPFIENSIEHGVSKIEGPGVISVDMNVNEAERLTCLIEDNGIGRKTGSNNGSGNRSMGMQIAKDRVGYLNQLTNNKTNFDIEDLEQGVRVTISIPHKTRF